MDNNNIIGNGSTIIKTLSLTIAGYILAGLAAQGYDLGIDVNILASLIGAIIGLIISYVDAKYPNTFKFLHNNNPTNPTIIEDEDLILNEEYEWLGDDSDGSC